MKHPQVHLFPGREKSILRRHPWIFSGAIQKVIGEPTSGETVSVIGSSGRLLGYGAFSGESQIRVRMWSFDPNDEVNDQFIHNRIRRAIYGRKDLTSLQNTNSRRLIYSENDGLPGIIADKYDNVVVLQLSTAGAYRWRETIIEEINNQVGCACLFEKSDADVIQLEGLEEVVKIQTGCIPDQRIIVNENGIQYYLDLLEGQKTGFYLDQRDNRSIIKGYAKGRSVLDCFSFSGGFTLNALIGGARKVTAVDSSEPALQLLAENVALNNMDSESVEIVQDNAFDHLRKLRDRGEHFDLIILDPPKFAPTTAQVERAARAYKDINLLAFKLLADKGVLLSFSCSGGVSMPLFHKIVADAALDAGREVQIIKFLHQAEDHPISTTFPEGEYLKGLVCKIV